MPEEPKSYLKHAFENPVHTIVQGIDRDVEKGEDILMLGLGSVMMSTFFAPIAPPTVILPAVALIFCTSVTFAHLNYESMEKKLLASIKDLDMHQSGLIRPIVKSFKDQPTVALSDSFNPIKNLRRTAKSCIGGLLINPFWMPIFYVMGIQIDEERNLGLLNRAIIGVEEKIFPKPLPVED